MLEIATSEAHRQALLRAHAERSAVISHGFAWMKSFFTARNATAATVASAS